MTVVAGNPIRVMVVDDSAVIRGLVGRIIEAEPDMKVVASVANGRAAVDMLRHKQIDVMLLDIEMPEMDGLTALPLLLELRPELPIIMNSSLTQRGAQVTMRALSLGAADYIPKPSALSAVSGMAAISAELVAKVRALGGARSAGATASGPPRQRPAARGAAGAEPVIRPRGPEVAPRVLAIASSTGGPNALSELLRSLPQDFPLPILITQHMPPLFTAALAERIARESGRPCAEATDGETVREGHTYIAPGDFHLTVSAAESHVVMRLDQSEPLNFCRPAADRMFRSIAAVYGSATLALVLTGMGEDGLRGAEEIVRRGGRVMAQDQASSVVWGMPGAVHRAGLTSATLPLGELAERVTHAAFASAVAS